MKLELETKKMGEIEIKDFEKNKAELELAIDNYTNVKVVNYTKEELNKHCSIIYQDTIKGFNIYESATGNKIVCYDDAKKIRALINSNSKLINDFKISVKKEYNEPYVNFENKMKELIALCSNVAEEYDNQIKKYEEEQKVIKKESIESLFNKLNTNKLIKFDRVFKEQWLNKTETLSSIELDMQDILNKISTDLMALKRIGKTDKEILDITNKYYIYYDLDKTLEAYDKEISIKNEIKEVEKENAQSIDKPIISCKLLITADKDKLKGLIDYMKENNIDFRCI